MQRVTVKLTGPNLQDGDVVAILRTGDAFHLNITGEDCEEPANQVSYPYKFEILSIDD